VTPAGENLPAALNPPVESIPLIIAPVEPKEIIVAPESSEPAIPISETGKKEENV
jgi:hypothetical protein